jgi:hypothetical protein
MGFGLGTLVFELCTLHFDFDASPFPEEPKDQRPKYKAQSSKSVLC